MLNYLTSGNVVTLLQKKVNPTSQKTACLYLTDHSEESITYHQLDKKARAIAAYLQYKNYAGKQVILLYPSGLDFVAAFLGCLYAGVTAVPMYCPKHTEFKKTYDLLNAIAQDADVNCILSTAEYLKSTEEWAQKTLTHKIEVVDSNGIDVNISALYQLPQINSDSIAYLQYTSGSTSIPKAVVIRHKHLFHNIKYTAKTWRYTTKSITLNWAPHSHIYGMICGLLVPLIHGGLTIIMPPDAFIQNPLLWLQIITKYQVTHSGCPNFGYDLCIQNISEDKLSELNLKSWKVAVNGGELVRHETLLNFYQKFSRCGFKLKSFFPAYGMSELTGTIASKPFAKKPKQLALAIEALKENRITVTKKEPHRFFISNGRLLPHLTACIVDPQTLTILPSHKIGEIWLAGKSVAGGYWQRLEETNQTFFATLANSSASYFRTGDLGFIKNNEVFITGRLKEIVILHGKKYYLQDIENTVKKALKPFVTENTCVCFTLNMAEKEELIILHEMDSPSLLTDETFQEMAKSIRSACTEQQGIDIYGIVLIKQGAIPKTASGKLQRQLCQQYYRENRFEIIKQDLKKRTHAETIENRSSTYDTQVNRSDFITIISNALDINPHSINLNDPISQYGFDSIKIIQLASLFNSAFSLNLTPAQLYEYRTLNEFYNALNHFHKKNNFDAHNSTAINRSRLDPAETPPRDGAHEIAIIGMSAVLPGAANIDIFWENLLAGKNAITEIPPQRWNWKKYYGEPLLETNKTKVKWGGFIDGIADFDAAFFNISAREAELIDPQQRLFLQTVWHTIEDAGYSTDELTAFKTGVFAGIFANDYTELAQKNELTDSYTTTGLAETLLANRISYLFDFHGPSLTINTACSSSLVAVHQAVQAIQNGECDIAIAGGVNALLTPSSFLSASKAGMLSEEGQCKPFDKNANGFVRSEGAGAVLLKPLAKAKADGDHIYGVIKGSAVNHGGHVSSLTVPNPNAQTEVMVSAYSRARVPINSISYIETHGTGTALGDPIEINALKNAFHSLQTEPVLNYYCGLGSVKSNIGHLESAAGIASLIKVLLAMQHHQLPATINFNELNPFIDLHESPFYIVQEKQDWQRLKNNNGEEIPRRAGVSAFGFGGTNAHVILEEYYDDSANTARNDENTAQHYLLTLSAKTKIALQQRIYDLYTSLSKQKTLPSLAALSYTLNQGRNHFLERCALIVSSIDELQHTLDKIVKSLFPANYILANAVNKNTARKIISFAELIETDDQKKLFTLGQLYTQGNTIDWNSLPQKILKQRIALPGYPFAKTSYWLPVQNIHCNSILPDYSLFMPQTKIQNPLLPLQEKFPDNFMYEFVHEIATLLKAEPQSIDINASLQDVGLDSIALKELAAKLHNRYNIELTPTLFFTYNNIKSLGEYLSQTHSREITLHQKSTIDISTHSSNDPIAIIGMQAYLPQSKDINEFWSHLLAGDDLISEIPIDRWDWQKYYGDAKQDPTKTNSKWGGFIENVSGFDAAFFNISNREANLMDPQQRLFLEIVWKTIEDAGYDPLTFSGQNIGIFAGVEFNEYQDLIQKQQQLFSGHLATGNSPALVTNRVSYFLNLHGPSETIDTACSSSLVAIHRAVNALRNNECNMAIAGGVSLMLDPQTLVITSQLGALSSDGRCKTFDQSANGYVKGEGIAAILLKPLHQAQKDGDPIYGIIKSSAVNHGGKAQSLTAPNAAAQTQLLIKAYQTADIEPETVSFIETHGTGTELGDPVEIEGLKQAFHALYAYYNRTPQKSYCALGAVKTNIGHLEPASGIAGVIKVLLAMQHEKLPGNLHLNELNAYIDLKDSPFYLIQKTQEWLRLKNNDGIEIPRRAGVSAFGFGGTNAHIIIEDFPLHKNNSNKSKPYYLFMLSAKQQESLKQKIIDLHAWLQKHLSVNIEDLSYTLNTGRSHFTERCAIVAGSITELLDTLQSLINNIVPTHCIMSVPTASKYEGPLFKEIYSLTMNAITNGSTLSPAVYHEKLLLLADFYTKYFSIDYNKLHHRERKERLAGLPAYPFIKKHYWFDAENDAAIKITESQPLKITPLNLNDFTQQYLQNIFATKLKLSPEHIDVTTTYEEYGIDSILGLEITHLLEKDFGTLPKTLLYERNRIRDLAAFFQQKYSTVLQQLAGLEATIPTEIDKPKTHSILPAQTGSNHDNDIAIIGLSGTFPLANNLDDFWDNLTQGRNCITEVPKERWDYKNYPVFLGQETKYFKYGGFIPDVDKFDPLLFKIAPTDAALMDPQERLFLQSVWTTLEDAGYTREKLQSQVNNEVGVFAGATYNFYPLFIAEEWAKGNRLPLDIQMFSIANRVSYFFDLSGPSYLVDTACSSGLTAIHLACESIQRGECKMAIAGGVNLSLHPSKYHFLGSYGFMSDEGCCASFASGAQGYVPAEGVGSILLKPLAQAIKDEDRIYGIIKSTAMNHGGKTSGYTVPNPNAQAAVIKTALDKAQIDPRTISYIEAHGTGTALGDPIEIRGLQEAFETYTSDKQFCAIGSVKSNIGHLESAAGISQLAKVLLQLQHKKLVPSIHAQITNPHIDFQQTPFYVQKELTDWHNNADSPLRAGISSFGAGGANVHIIVEEYRQPVIKHSVISMPFIFLISAQNNERLQEYIQKIYQFLLHESKQHSEPDKLNSWLLNACFTSQTGRENFSTRFAVMGQNFNELLSLFKLYIDNPAANDPHLWLGEATVSKSIHPEISDLIKNFDYKKLILLWINGAKVNWEQLYSNPKPRRMSLPTYPFAKRRCWIPTQIFAQEVVSTTVVTELKSPVSVKITVDRDSILVIATNLLAEILGLDQSEIDPSATYQDYGLDSINGINFVGKLSEHYPDIVSPMDLYRYPSLNLLVDFIGQTMEAASAENPHFSTHAANEDILFEDEHTFTEKLSGLNNEQVRQLLEAELKELDNL